MPELPLTMPKMSMTMEEGTMVSWLKQPGDAVRSGEPICEVATDKVDMEVESPFDGVLARIIADVDEVIAVGETIGFITTDSDDLLGGLFDVPGDPAHAVSDADLPAVPEAAAPASSRDTDTGRVRAVPRARSLAAEHGIDLHTVTATGPWHTIRVSDVEAVTTHAVTTHAVAAPAVDPVEARRRRTRSQLAKVMTASAAVPQFTAYLDLDLSSAAAIRRSTLGGASWTVLLMRAHAIALHDVSALNAIWDGERAVASDDIGVALAVDSPTGLIAPVLRNPHRGALAALADAVTAAVEATRSGTVGLDLLTGGTTVLSNLGGLGVDSFNALLTPPHATALSAGAVANRVYATSEGALGVRLQCTVGITVDHRVADGADAARYLARLRELFISPESLL